MKLTDLFYITFQNLQNRKSRVFFTILGVAVAIAAVFSLVAFGYGLQQSLLEKITTAESLLTLDAVPVDANVIRLNDEVLERVARLPYVEKVSPQASIPSEVSYGDIISSVTTNVVYPDFFVLQGVAPMAGRFFNARDVKKVMVTSVVAQLLNVKPEEIVGKKIKLIMLPGVGPVAGEDVSENASVQAYVADGYEVAGVLESQGSEGEVYVNRADVAFVPITEYKLVKVKAEKTEVMKGVRDNLIASGFIVSALSDVVEQANKIFHVVQIALGIFGVIALVVAAIGLVNTMTIALLERTNEIGVMRAIGASSQDVERLFLGESTFIGFFGGVGGLLLGFLASEVLNWLFNFIAHSFNGNGVRLFAYPLWFIVFIIVLSTAVGFLGGIWPAYRAAKMNPLQALKYK